MNRTTKLEKKYLRMIRLLARAAIADKLDYAATDILEYKIEELKIQLLDEYKKQEGYYHD